VLVRKARAVFERATPTELACLDLTKDVEYIGDVGFVHVWPLADALADTPTADARPVPAAVPAAASVDAAAGGTADASAGGSTAGGADDACGAARAVATSAALASAPTRLPTFWASFEDDLLDDECLWMGGSDVSLARDTAGSGARDAVAGFETDAAGADARSAASCDATATLAGARSPTPRCKAGCSGLGHGSPCAVELEEVAEEDIDYCHGDARTSPLRYWLGADGPRGCARPPCLEADARGVSPLRACTSTAARGEAESETRDAETWRWDEGACADVELEGAQRSSDSKPNDRDAHAPAVVSASGTRGRVAGGVVGSGRGGVARGSLAAATRDQRGGARRLDGGRGCVGLAAG
jgi:hypothetical protein